MKKWLVVFCITLFVFAARAGTTQGDVANVVGQNGFAVSFPIQSLEDVQSIGQLMKQWDDLGFRYAVDIEQKVNLPEMSFDNPTLTTWSKINSISSRNVFAVSATTLYRSGLSSGFQRSTDGGNTWTNVAIIAATHNRIYFSGTTNGWVGYNNYSGNTGGVLRTTNGGSSWTAVGIPGLSSGGVTDVQASGSLVVAVGTADLTLGVLAGTIHISTDGGVSWTLRRSGVQQMNTVYVSDLIIIAAGDSGFVTRSTDGGVTWSDQVLPGIEKLKDVQLTGATGTLVGFTLPTRKGRVYRTTNSGASWTLVREETSLSLFNGVALGSNGLTGVIVGQNSSGFGSIWDTEDGGASLTVAYANSVVGGALYGVSFFGDVPGYAVGQDGLVKNSDHPLPVQLASFTGTLIENNRVRLNWMTISEINNYGFYVQRRSVGVQEWTEIANSFVPGHGTTNEPQYYSFTDPTPITAATQYRLRQVDLDGTSHYSDPIQVDLPTSVPEVAPREFALKQNYPNPFNPTTEIKFSVENTGHAKLDVYNALGQKVATLFDGIAEAGQYYTVRFTATGLASGVYFYRLESGKRSDVKKLVLMK